MTNEEYIKCLCQSDHYFLKLFKQVKYAYKQNKVSKEVVELYFQEYKNRFCKVKIPMIERLYY